MTARVSGQEEFQTGEDEVGLKHSIIPLIEKQVRHGTGLQGAFNKS